MPGLRMMVTIPDQMRVAIDILAQNDAVAPSTKARQLLRQALSRTMESAEYTRRCEAQGLDPKGHGRLDDGR
jgi:hypothetical protein